MKNILLGMAVGDALGVPYEFKSKNMMKLNPCTDMVGHGTHNQPAGTWSDDTSMALCIVDSLINGLNYTHIADKFHDWLYGSLWTPHGKVFDNGLSTRRAIDRWVKGDVLAIECGGTDIDSNGNGSVMRTLALVPFIEDMDLDTRYGVVSNVSAITHGHWISKFSCLLVCEYAIALRNGFNKSQAFDISVRYLEEARDTEIAFGDLSHETDTTGCVTGGLAGIMYGVEGIPLVWLNGIARKDDIIDLVEQYESTYETA